MSGNPVWFDDSFEVVGAGVELEAGRAGELGGRERHQAIVAKRAKRERRHQTQG